MKTLSKWLKKIVSIYSLYTIIEQFCNGYKLDVLNFISFISVLAGVFVIITKNPIISIIFLICLFLSIACYLILIGISYIGLSYILVYIGAILILFLFILMLINIRISELQSETSNSLALALILGTSFYYIVQDIIPLGVFSNNVFFDTIDFSYANLFFVTSGSWDILLIENLHITTIGNLIYTSHFILLIMVSIILLLAMVGSIIITIRS